MLEVGKTHTRIFGNCKQGLRLLAILTLLAVVQGCAPAKHVSTPVPVHVLTEAAPFGATMTLEEMIRQTLAHQYPSPRIDFPVPDKTGRYFIELAHEPVMLQLATGAMTFQAGPQSEAGPRTDSPIAVGLAAGLDNGDIRIWSSWPCPLLTLPTETPVSLLAWDGSGPYLGAGGEISKDELHIFDLRYCAHVATVASERALSTAALSSSLTRVALVDVGRRLHVGPVDGPLEYLGTLRYPPLAVQFSPREGLLQIVDQAGWLLIWALPGLDLLDQRRIPGGPFDAAMFHDGRIALRIMEKDEGFQELFEVPSGERTVVWNIPEGRLISGGELMDSRSGAFVHPFILLEQLDLESGILSYRTKNEHWLRKLHFGSPRLEAHVAADEGLLRISDIDQVQRWYSLRDGSLLESPEPAPAELRPLPVDVDATVRWGDREYVLADPVLARDGYLLLARHVPDERFFLWWVAMEPDLSGYFHGKGLLPIRESLRRELAPQWISLPDDQAAPQLGTGSP
ncbi:hypothetical protein SAMN05660653_02794 [Desulfonatronum thiosulfatophilum]|uniref:Lipoprotein n=1 Tax=Desulfonatronum thiosulfatophilum TaxID=617002 RepID=A0A1G6EEE5_9BACT|nr:hypothetical protein [Desulfonatronum thiosulfatophilum]SDB55690.1 hypothetical protein SAMN05660653_02794 [Desulfonatronum thiosulfatophilum]